MPPGTPSNQGPDSSKPRGNDRADWRKKRGAAVGGAAAGGGGGGRGSQPTWAKGKATSHAADSLWHRIKLAFWFGFFAIGSAALVALWLFWPQETPFIALAVTDYADRSLPCNALAREDVDRLATTNSGNLAFTEIDGKLASRDSLLSALRDQLKAVRPGGPGVGLSPGRVTLLYISAHGVVNQNNEPCLLLNDAAALDPSSWLKVEELLDAICLDENKSVRGGQTVLFLDANRVQTDWRLGLLYNGFAERLQPLVEDRARNLTVFNSAGPGELGWTAPELNGSVFGHFVSRGLQGEADVAGNGDDKVTCGELSAYLAANVDGWTRRHRGDRQRPQLLPALSHDRIALTFTGGSSGEKPSAIKVPEAAIDSVVDLWRKFDALRNADSKRGPSPMSRHPSTRAEVERRLLHLESRLWAGTEYQENIADETAEIDRLMQEIAQSNLPSNVTATSLPFSLRLAGKDVEEKRPTSPFTLWKKSREKEPPEPFVFPKTATAEEYAGDVWDRLIDDRGAPLFRELEAALEFLRATGKPSKTEYVELHFLKMLHAQLDRQPRVEETATAAIRTRRNAERVTVPSDERVHYALRQPTVAADETRRKAEDLLFVGSPESLDRADDLYAKLMGRSDVTGEYNAVDETARTLAAALATRDASWADLPHLSRWVLQQRRFAGEKFSGEKSASELSSVAAIDKWIAETHRLSETIERASFDPTVIPDARDAEVSVRTLSKEARRTFDEYVEALTHQAATGGDSTRRLLDCLSTPLVSADDRRLLFLKYAAALDSAVDSVDPAANKADAAVAGEIADTPLVIELCAPESHPALAICGVKLEKRAVSSAKPTRESCLLDLCRQGDLLRTTLGKTRADCDEMLRDSQRTAAISPARPQAEVRNALSRADRRVRAAAGILGERIWNDVVETPSENLRRLDWAYLSLWHAQRALDDYWGPTPGGERPESYFQIAAAGYLANPARLGWTALAPQLDDVDLRSLAEKRRRAAADFATLKIPDEPSFSGDDVQAPLKVDVAFNAENPTGLASLFLHADETFEKLIPVRESTGKSVRRHGVPTSARGAEANWETLLTRESLPPGADYLHASLLYRGHTRTQDAKILRENDRKEIVWPRPRYEAPKITIAGDSKPTNSVMFILDVSGSMNEMVGLEGGGVGKIRRWEVARGTFVKTIDEFVGKGLRIGFMTYGKNFKDRSINPNEDVTLEVPFGRELTAVLREEMAGRLEKINPDQGYTPISYSLIKALENMADYPAAEGTGAIVLITDGIEQFFVESVREQPAVDAWTDSVRQRLGAKLKESPSNRVPIFIIGIDFDNVIKTKASEVERLEKLAVSTGGKFTAVSGARDLSEAIRASLETTKYSVQKKNDDAPRELLDMNQRWLPAQWRSSQAGAYTVAVSGPVGKARTDVMLQGGESLELLFNARESRLEFKPFRKDARGEGRTMNDPSDPQRAFLVLPHLPDHQGGNVALQFSVQARHPNREEWYFSPRPACVWAEVRPRMPEGSIDRPVFYYYEPTFVADRPVPVFRFDVPNWPEEATDAEVKLWFHPTEDVAPNLVIPIDERNEITSAQIPGVSLKVEKKVKTAVNRELRFVVTEKHEPGAAVVPLRVQMSPEPDLTLRHYEEKDRTWKTTFVYSDLTPLNLQQPAVKFTTKATITAHAIAVDREFLVAIPPSR